MRIESEKVLERKFNEAIKKKGGWSLKMLSNYVTGLPDRVCLMPGGKVFFAEIKTTGKKPTKIQVLIHKKLTELGFEVLIIQSSEEIEYYEPLIKNL